MMEETNPDLFIPVGFAGGLRDRDTGFVRCGYRDYDPYLGRFTCPDPLGDTGGDHDLYDYCVDDPVNMTDPSGLFGQFLGQQGLKERATEGIEKQKPKQPEAPVPEQDYYTVQERPLDVPFPFGEGLQLLNKNWHHRHIVGNKGEDRGLFPGGEFRKDDPALMGKYKPRDNNHYDGKIMKESMEQVEKEKKEHSAAEKNKVGERYDELKHIPGFDDNIDKQQAMDSAGGIYFVGKYDCRNYPTDVVKRGHEIAKKQGKKFILNK